MKLTVKDIMPRDCTGCAACMNKCPKNAIIMKADSEGFLFPVINEELCIDCGLCHRVCPAINPHQHNTETPAAYAVMADDETRKNSSSGGAFSLLAKHIISEGGAVVGAVMTEDCMRVEHRIATSMEEVAPMRSSKYLQSETGYVYRRIKDLLASGKKVLYTGCPCQVAGLYAYLGRTDIENLYTADLVCHGVCSPLAYRKMLEEKAQGRTVKSVNFRSKEKYGWAHSLSIRFADGSAFDEGKKDSKWYRGFLWGLINRRNCGDCYYARIPRMGDVTIGDLWEVEKMLPQLNDKKGVSLFLTNSKRGRELLEAIVPNATKCEAFALRDAVTGNASLSEPHRRHPNRKHFFAQLDTLGFSGAVDAALPMKQDIGVIGWWFGKNYGSTLTYFGLHEYLTDHGYSVAMYGWPFNDTRRYADFYRTRYEIKVGIRYPDMMGADSRCDNYVVGSDQLWSYGSAKECGWYFMLDFVHDTKRKISYSTSFGHDQSGYPAELAPKASMYLKRFNALSVREKSGIDICRNEFGVDAVQTVDPAFLCGRRAYERVIRDSKLSFDKPYLMAYILSPSSEKKEAILRAANHFGLEIKVFIDNQSPDKAESARRLGLEEYTLLNAGVEDWLYCIKNASMVITDSFHGTVFSMIFEQPFVSIINPIRGAARFHSLLGGVDLADRMIPPEALGDDTILHVLEQPIDYRSANRLLNEKVEASKKWLEDALHAPLPEPTGYDLMLDEQNRLNRRIVELNRQHAEDVRQIEQRDKDIQTLRNQSGNTMMIEDPANKERLNKLSSQIQEQSELTAQMINTLNEQTALIHQQTQMLAQMSDKPSMMQQVMSRIKKR